MSSAPEFGHDVTDGLVRAPGGDVLAPDGLALPGARTGRDPARAIKRGPSRLPPEVVAATQRDRLFDGLVHVVAEKGYPAARVSDICQAAGVTRPVFYTLFEGKDDAFLATYRHGINVLVRMMEDAYREAGDWRDGARAALRTVLDVLSSVPAFATMAIVEIETAGPAARLERAMMLRRFDQFFTGAPFAAASAADPDDLLATIVGGIYTTIYRYVLGGRVAELPSLAPTLTFFALAPFIGREAAEQELARAQAAQGKAAPPCVPGGGTVVGR
jgi:AcrR family transcriptional regulator